MLTNPRDKFRGQPRSPNKTHKALKCTVVTLSLRRAVLQIFDFRKCRDLEIRVRGHPRSLKVVPFDRLLMVSYWRSTVTLSLKIFDL